MQRLRVVEFEIPPPPPDSPETKFYRGTSITRNRYPLGTYCRPIPRVRGGSYGSGRVLISEVPLYAGASLCAMRGDFVRFCSFLSYNTHVVRGRARLKGAAPTGVPRS